MTMAQLAVLLRQAPPVVSLLALVKWDENQARDDAGRFGSGGGGADASDPPTLKSLFSDSLGIARGDMPQIPNDHKPKFAAELKERGVSMKPETVSASSLKPTQKDFNAENVAFLRGEIAAGRYKDNPIVVSREGRVLDGHHRWAVEAQDGGKIDVLRVDLPIKDLLRAAASFNTRHGITARSVSDMVTRAKLGKLLKAWNPDQERDERGRWSSGGGGDSAQTSSERMGRDTLSMEPSEVLPGLLMQQAHDAIAQHGGQPDDAVRMLTADETATARAELAASLALASAAKPAFDASVKNLAQALGGRASLADIKGGERLFEKHVVENGSDPAKMMDLVRGSIVVHTPQEAQRALEAIKERYELARRAKDRFAHPLPTGYSDILVNVRLPNGAIGEIQVHIPEMIAAKKIGHDLYNIERKMRDDHPAKRELVSLQSAIYSAAKDANRRRRGGGG